MSEKIKHTRQYIQKLVGQMNSDSADLCETVLIRDGLYCGHRFSCDAFTAVWFFEENELKIYDADHNLLRVESLGETEVKRAA